MTRGRRGLLTRWELGITALVLLALGAFATSEIRLLRLRTARAEVGMVLTALRIHLDDVERPRPFEAVPRAPERLGTDRIAWDGLPVAGFTPPVARVRGAYALEAGDPGTLVGWIDADGDGRRATYRLPLEQGELERITPASVY